MNAKDASCCAWMQHNALVKRKIIGEGHEEGYCGLSESEFMRIAKWEKKKNLDARDRKEAMRQHCCADEPEDSFGDCDSFNWPKGKGMVQMLEMAKSNENFYKAYLEAWKDATENGWDLTPLE